MKDAFLIEVSHNVLGVLATVTGIGRLLELRLPHSGRVPVFLWTWSLILTGVVLLFYREL